MTEISASMVVKLRKMSGQGMMDCKVALQEAGGDIEQAMTILRKKGLATLAKRAERETTEGLVVCKNSDDGKTAILATLCCETDFVAKSEDFAAAAGTLADYALACPADEGAENIPETAVDGKKFSDILRKPAVRIRGLRLSIIIYTWEIIISTNTILGLNWNEILWRPVLPGR